MADATAITTIAKVKDYLGIGGTTYDTFFTELIAEVQADIESKTGRHFPIVELTEYYDGDGTRELFLNYRPITSVTNLYDDTERAYGAGTEIASTGFVIYSNKGIIRLVNDLCFNRSDQNIKIVYKTGWSTIPEDIEKVAIEMVARIFRASNKGNKDLGVESRKEGEGTVGLITENYLPGHEEVIEKYRDIRV